MNKKFDKLAIFEFPSVSIDNVVRRMAKESRKVLYPGLAVFLDESGVLLGILTDGDIRRAYSKNINFSLPVSEIMTINPVTIQSEISVDTLMSSDMS